MVNEKESKKIRVAYVLGDNKNYEKLFEQTSRYNKENNTNFHLESPENQLEMLLINRDPNTVVLADLGALVEKLPKEILKEVISNGSIYFINDATEENSYKKLLKNATKKIGMNLKWDDDPTSYYGLISRTFQDEKGLFSLYNTLSNKR